MHAITTFFSSTLPTFIIAIMAIGSFFTFGHRIFFGLLALIIISHGIGKLCHRLGAGKAPAQRLSPAKTLVKSPV